MKKVLLMMLVIVAIASSCKKEDQTTKILKKIYGYRTLKKYTVNGVDSLSLFKDSLGLHFNFHYDDIDERYVLRIDGATTTITEGSTTCYWRLQNTNYIYLYNVGGAYGTGPFGRDKTPIFQILCLDIVFILKTSYNGKDYYLELQ